MRTSSDFGASHVSDVYEKTNVRIKMAHPGPDRTQRSKISPDGLDGLRSISSNVGTASPIDAFKALTFKAPDPSVHGDLPMFDPAALNGDADEQLRMLVLALTDKDALRGLVGQHPGLEVMRGNSCIARARRARAG